MPPHLADNLHAILSSKTPVSHPLCTECTTMLQSELQKELEDLSKERDAYIEFQRGIARNKEALGRRGTRHGHAQGQPSSGRGGQGGQTRRSGGTGGEEDDEVDGLGAYDLEGTDEEWEALQRRKKDLEKEEEALKRELEGMEKELEKARLQEAQVKEEEAAVDREEDE